MRLTIRALAPLGPMLLASSLQASWFGQVEELDAVKAGFAEHKIVLAQAAEKAERSCEDNLEVLAQRIISLRYTCTSRCSSGNLWLLFGAASAPTAQSAYDALADRCEAAGAHIVDKQVSCLANYSRASLHEEFEDDCAARTRALQAELTVPRMRCFAKLQSREGWPYEAEVSAPNAAQAFLDFSNLAERGNFSFKSFAPGTDCVSTR